MLDHHHTSQTRSACAGAGIATLKTREHMKGHMTGENWWPEQCTEINIRPGAIYLIGEVSWEKVDNITNTLAHNLITLTQLKLVNLSA